MHSIGYCGAQYCTVYWTLLVEHLAAPSYGQAITTLTRS